MRGKVLVKVLDAFRQLEKKLQTRNQEYIVLAGLNGGMVLARSVRWGESKNWIRCVEIARNF